MRLPRQVPMDTFAAVDLPAQQALCRLDEVPESGATAVDAMLADGEESVIVLRRDGAVHAYVNVCPHAGRRLDYAPGKFLLKGDTLICAVHGATFQQTSGTCVAGPCCGDALRELPVSVRDGVVWLDA
jgi:nitrite reductase/ring-hydroxylating ferredoxin subunit